MPKLRRWALLALTPVLAVACDQDGTSPGELDSALLRVLADEAVQNADEEVGFMRAPRIPGLRFPSHIPGVDEKPDCPENGGRFHCNENRGPVEVDWLVTFFDVSGAVQDGYDDQTTASVRIEASFAGEMVRRFKMGSDVGGGSVEGARDMLVSGLEGDESTRIWNGTTEGRAEFTGREGFTRSSSHSSTITDLVIPHPRDGDSWPLSGRIASEMTIDGLPDQDDPVTRTVVVTYDGTQFASVEMDGEVHTVDLSERRGRWGRGHWGSGR